MRDKDIIVNVLAVHFLPERVIELPFDILAVNEPIASHCIPAAVKSIVDIHIRIKLIVPRSELEIVSEVYLCLYTVTVLTLGFIAILRYVFELQVYRLPVECAIKIPKLQVVRNLVVSYGIYVMVINFFRLTKDSGFIILAHLIIGIACA